MVKTLGATTWPCYIQICVIMRCYKGIALYDVLLALSQKSCALTLVLVVEYDKDIEKTALSLCRMIKITIKL